MLDSDCSNVTVETSACSNANNVTDGGFKYYNNSDGSASIVKVVVSELNKDFLHLLECCILEAALS